MLVQQLRYFLWLLVSVLLLRFCIRQLMPLAFAAGIGGIITMVGTPPNIIVSGTLSKFGIEPFGFL